MENSGKGKGFGFFRRNRTPSSSSGGRATRSPSRDRNSDGPDHSGHITPRPTAPEPRPPSPARRAWNYARTRMTAAKRVRPGIQFNFREPEPFPDHSPQDEDEVDDDDDDEAEPEGAPVLSDDEPMRRTSDDEEDMEDGQEEEEDDDGPDESVPMAEEFPDLTSRTPEQVPVVEPQTHRLRDAARREMYEEHLRGAREYPSEKEMMREAIRRSRQQAYAPPPLPPPAFYPSPPPHYQMYPPYPPFTPYQPYPQFPAYPPYFEPPRGSFAGSSSHDIPIDVPRRSSGSYIDPDELEEIKTRADSMERERNYYRELYLAETKGKKGKNKK